MGIPNLTRSLTPYSTPIHISPSTDPSSTPSTPSTISSLIIDGPGLIYHIHHRLLAQKVRNATTHLNGIDAQPSCAEVSEGVVRFLYELVVRQGVDVKKIYFDGALPLSKRATRLERMETQRRRLEAWGVGFRGGFKVTAGSMDDSTVVTSIGGDDGDVVAALFQCGEEAVSEKYRGGLPENPFMVSATIEDLRGVWRWGRVRGVVGDGIGVGKGKGEDDDDDDEDEDDDDDDDEDEDEDEDELAFAHLVEMVPNEADIYCAEAARRSTAPVAVLTSDSDLLVHDLGEGGRVVFYDSLELSSPLDQAEKGRGRVIIKAMELHPSSIATRLGVVSLPRLAFEMKCERGVSLNEAVRRAKDSSGRVEGSAKFRAFMEEYEPLPPLSSATGMGEKERERSWSGISNPKLGELVAQFEVPSLRGKNTGEGYHVYLPTLIEDPTRRSAWCDGAEIRRVAYSILNLSFDDVASRKEMIYEFSRRGARIAYTSLPLTTSVEDLAVDLETGLLSKLRLIQTLLPVSEYPVQFWTLFALFEIYSAGDANVPSPKEIMTFLMVGRMGTHRLTWEDIRLYARMLGVLYSVKGVGGEVVGVVDADAKEEGWEVVREVKGWMETLPRGSELFCDKRERGGLFKGSWVGDVVRGWIGLVRESCEEDREEGTEEGENGDAEGWIDSGKGKGTKGKKRGRRRSGNEIEKEKLQKKGKNNKKGGNMFDILAGIN